MLIYEALVSIQVNEFDWSNSIFSERIMGKNIWGRTKINLLPSQIKIVSNNF